MGVDCLTLSKFWRALMSASKERTQAGVRYGSWHHEKAKALTMLEPALARSKLARTAEAKACWLAVGHCSQTIIVSPITATIDAM